VVSPDGHLLDFSDSGSGLESELGKGSVVVETSHGSEVLSWDIGSIVLADHGVGVGGVADDDGPDVTGAVVVDGFADIDEDLAVVLEEVSTLHAGATGLGSDKEVEVNIPEGGGKIGGDHDLVKHREGTIVEFGLDTLEDLLLEGEIEEMEDNSLVLSEEFATIEIKLIIAGN